MLDDTSHPDDHEPRGADDLPDEEVSRHLESEMPTLDPSSVPGTGEGATIERKSIADRAKVPERIGPYRILSVIGFGGMGGVYEAVQEDPRRRVALKIIKPGCVSEQSLRRFRFEAQVLGTLQHPGIAQIYEAGTFEDDQGERPYYAMEFIAGAKSITDYVTANNLSVEDRLDLFKKVCDAVHHGHQKGIIHRDLKPDNILVNASGNPKIIDFGVARTTDADLAVKTMETSFGQILGTLQYMSPEQVEGDPSQLDTRSDVYALGIILYELLCDQLPYDVKKKALHEAIRVIQEDPPDRPSTITRVIRGDIETITLKAIEKQRDRRYDSAAAFGRDIGRFLESEPIEARRASMGYQLRMFSKRHQVTVGAAVMVVLAITIGLVLFWVSWARAERLNVQLEIEKTNVVRERNVAQEQLAETKGVHRDLQGLTLRNIRRLNGAISEKERLARSVVEYFRGLEDDERDEQDLIVLAKARMELAQVLGGRSQDNLGRYDDAVEELKRAIELWRDLVTVNPGELGRVQYLALARSRLSDVYQVQGKYLEAVHMLELATQSLEEVLEGQPENAGTLRVLSNIYQNMADVRLNLDDQAMALAALRRMDELLTVALELNPDHKGFQLDRGNNLRRLGYLQQESNPAEAVGLQESSLKIFKSLHESQPDSADAAQNVGLAWLFLARAESQVPMRDDAIDHVGRGWDVIVLHCSLNAQDAKAREHVRMYLQELGDILLQLEAEDRLPSHCRSAVLVLQPVVEANPDNLALAEMVDHVLATMREGSVGDQP